MQPHVLLLQNPQPDVRSVYIGLLDPHSTDGIVGSVRVVATPTTRAHLLAAVDILHECLPGHVDCMTWWGEHELQEGHALPARQGYSFLIIMNHLQSALASGLQQSSLDDSSTDSVSLLQKSSNLVQQHTLVLDELLPVEPDQHDQPTPGVPIRLIPGTADMLLPSYIECPVAYTLQDIHKEIACCGHDCDVYRFGPHDCALCLPSGWHALPGHFHLPQRPK